MDMRKDNADSGEIGGIRVFFQKLIMIAMLPFLCAGVSYGFWYTYEWIKKHKNVAKSKSISTLIILLFLVHPNIVQSMFYNFKCTNVDGEERI